MAIMKRNTMLYNIPILERPNNGLMNNNRTTTPTNIDMYMGLFQFNTLLPSRGYIGNILKYASHKFINAAK